jgi:hypothetical protein
MASSCGCKCRPCKQDGCINSWQKLCSTLCHTVQVSDLCCYVAAPALRSCLPAAAGCSNHQQRNSQAGRFEVPCVLGPLVNSARSAMLREGPQLATGRAEVTQLQARPKRAAVQHPAGQSGQLIRCKSRHRFAYSHRAVVREAPLLGCRATAAEVVNWLHMPTLIAHQGDQFCSRRVHALKGSRCRIAVRAGGKSRHDDARVVQNGHIQ